MPLPSCCPPSAWPALAPDANCAGKVEQVQGVDVYRTTGGCKEPAKDKVIYHFYDIFGLEGGRSRQFCDTLAELFKCEVIFIDGNVIDGKKMIMNPNEMDKVVEFLASIPWAKMKDNYYKVVDELEKGQTRSIAMTSTCWGTVAHYKLAGTEGSSHEWHARIKVGATWHPSLQVVGFEKEDPLEVGKGVASPQLVCPCKDDDAMYDGPLIDVLPKGTKRSDYRDQAHGFIVRGDPKDEAVKARITEAVTETYDFFKANGF